MKVLKILKEKKKNSSPNTEFKIEIYEEIIEGKNKGKYSPKKIQNVIEYEYDIIDKIKSEHGVIKITSQLKSALYRTLSGNELTIVTANPQNNTVCLKSISNNTNKDNISDLKTYE